MLIFFQLTLKLVNKIKNGSKTIKKYDTAKTPYQRMLSCEHIQGEVKDKLTEQYKKLDPIIAQLGPVIGAHLGPNVLGLGYIKSS